MIAERFLRHLARGQLIICLGIATLLTGQTIVPESQQLVPDPPLTQSVTYGASVAIDTFSGIAAVGATAGTGAAYIFRRDLGGIWWQDDQFLGIGPSENLGRACAVSGDVVAIGVPRRALGLAMPGAVDIYRWTGALWSQEPTLMPYTQNDAEFGRVVLVNSDLLVVAAPQFDLSPMPGRGTVHVYRDQGFAGWVVETVLTNDPAFPASTSSGFGSSLATDGQVIAVGDPAQGSNGSLAGMVHIFRMVGGAWNLDAILSGVTDQGFGVGVAVRDDLLVVGAPRTNGWVGAVHIFRHDGVTWQEEAVLTGNIPSSGFGSRVAIEENRVLTSQTESPVHSVHIYQETGGVWSETETLVPTSTSISSRFGQSLAVSGSTVVVGASKEETLPGVETGAAYLFELTSTEFRRGDANDDGTFNIADAITALDALFGPASPIGCSDAGDANDDGTFNIADPIRMLSALFVPGVPPLPAPHPGCGEDPTGDNLPCASFSSCP